MFDLGVASHQLAVAKVNGNQLQVPFYQKGTRKPAATFTAASILATVSLDLKPGIPVGTPVSLGLSPAKPSWRRAPIPPLAITIAPDTLIVN